MSDESENNEESEFHKRTERLEVMLEKAYRNQKPVEYSLLIDELGVEPLDFMLYDTGFLKREWLGDAHIREIKEKIGLLEVKSNEKAIEKSYLKENSAIGRRIRKDPIDYTIAQYEKDRSILQYVQLKGIDFNKDNQISTIRNLLTEICGYKRLRVGQGEDETSFVLITDPNCKASRIKEAGRGAYKAARRRLEEYERGERSLIN
jgi:hypothetical protein